jgi:hypothetical protein
LYGSFARNQQDAASDVDVLVVGKPKSDTLAEIVQKLERRLGREINYTASVRSDAESLVGSATASVLGVDLATTSRLSNSFGRASTKSTPV